jgi:hypothetical protein
MNRKDVLATLPPLTEDQVDVIVGSLLGDANLKRFSHDRNSYMTKPQSEEKVEYIRWHYDFLRPYSGSIRQYRLTERVSSTGHRFTESRGFIFSTVAHPVFTALRSKWYPDDSDHSYLQKKRIPSDLRLNPRVIAVWLADDGTTSHSDRRIGLCTQGFPECDVDLLVDQLRSVFAFKCKKVPAAKSYMIRVSAESYKSFLDLVIPYFPWKCLGHKVDLSGYRELPRNNTSGCRGVVWDKRRKRWRAEIKLNGKKVHLGRYDSYEDAMTARRVADEHYRVKVGRRWIPEGSVAPVS